MGSCRRAGGRCRMPADKASERPLYFELRRDGRPVDPQPWLARSEDGQPADSPGASDERNGDQKVRQ